MVKPVGFEKLALNPRLMGSALGAGFGFAAAPEDEGATGAIMGAGLGYGLGALGSRLHGKLTGPPAAGAPAPAGPPVAPMSPDHDALIAQHNQERMQQFDAALAHHQRTTPAPVPLPQAPMAPTARPGPGPKKPIPLRPKVGFEILKQSADYNVSGGIPGVAGASVAGRDERLEGMRRWVPRSAIERAYASADAGFDEDAIREEAEQSGSVTHPAVGAGIGAALAHYGLPSGIGPKLMGAAVGAGAGSIYHNATAGNRADDASEALRGVRREREKMTHHSARESVPLVMSNATSAT